MKLNCMQVVLLVLVAIGAVAGSANATIDYQVWYTKDGGLGTTRPGEGISGWTKAPSLTPYPGTTFTLADKETVWFSMDNFWYANHAKWGFFNLSTTAEGFFGSSGCTLDFGYRYDPRDINPDDPGSVIIPSGSKTWTPTPSHGGRGVFVEFDIIPQPSWEWLSVQNTSGKPVTFTNADGYSACTHTPEPSLGLLLLAGIVPLGIGLRRRRQMAK